MASAIVTPTILISKLAKHNMFNYDHVSLYR